MIKLYVGLLCSAMGITSSLSYSQNISINTDGTSGPALFNVGNTTTPPFRILSTGQVLGLNSGTAATPSYSFVDEANTGMYKSGTNSLGFSVGGTQRVNISNTGVFNINQLAGTGNRMLSANAAGDVIVNTTITKMDPILVRGTGLNNNADRIVKFGNTDLTPGNGRGLNFIIINKSSHAIVSNTTYDTFGDVAASNALATALNGLTNAQIGILSSYDAWEGQITTNLQNAFLRLGLYKAYRTTVGGSRRPYAAIFEGASSAAVSSSQAFEVEYSDNANQPYADVRGWVVDGGIVATTQIHSGLSSPIGTPAVTVSEANNVFSTANIISGKALVSGKIEYRAGPPPSADNQFHNVALSTNYAITGLSMYCSGSFLDGDIRLNGQEVTGLYSGTTGWYGLNAGATAAGSTTNTVGTGADNQTHTCNCPDGYVAMGIEIRANNQLDGNMKLLCAQLGAGLTTSESGMGIESVYSYPNANADNSTHVSVCPMGTFVKGVSVYSNTYFDTNLKVYCTGVRAQ